MRTTSRPEKKSDVPTTITRSKSMRRDRRSIAATPDAQRTSARMPVSDRRITSHRNSSSDTINIRCMDITAALPAGDAAPKTVPEPRTDKKSCRTACL